VCVSAYKKEEALYGGRPFRADDPRKTTYWTKPQHLVNWWSNYGNSSYVQYEGPDGGGGEVEQRARWSERVAEQCGAIMEMIRATAATAASPTATAPTAATPTATAPTTPTAATAPTATATSKRKASTATASGDVDTGGQKRKRSGGVGGVDAAVSPVSVCADAACIQVQSDITPTPTPTPQTAQTGVGVGARAGAGGCSCAFILKGKF
jgi:hypothetical protein